MYASVIVSEYLYDFSVYELRYKSLLWHFNNSSREIWEWDDRMEYLVQLML